VSITEETPGMSTFVTPDGLLQYKVMLFGM